MTQDIQSAQTPSPPNRGRKWLKRLVIGSGLLLILLIGGVLMVPTLLSTHFGKGILLGQASPLLLDHPNAKLDIRSLSLGWFSGQRIEGIRVTDKDQIVALDASVRTDLSLLSAVRGHLNLGNTVIDLDIVRLKLYDDGTSNLQRTFTIPAGSDEPTVWPGIKGKVALNLTGTVEPPSVGGQLVEPIKIEKGSVVLLDFNNAETSIPLEGKLIYQTQGKVSTLEFSANIDAIDNNIVLFDPAKLTASADVRLTQIDLSVLNAILTPLGMPVNRIEGVVNGQAKLDLKPGLDASLGSDIAAQNVVIDIPQLNGDVLVMNQVRFPADLKRQDQKIVIQNTGIVTPLGSVNVQGELPQMVLANMLAGDAPGGAGQVKITTNGIDLASLAKQLPNTMRLVPGVVVTGGSVVTSVDVALKPDAVAIGQLTQISGIRGKRDGKDLLLQDTTFQASLTVPTSAGKLDTANIKDLAVNLASPVANLQGGGAMDALSFIGDSDLTKLQSQLAQFVDLGDLQLAGKADLAIKTTGNLLDLTKPVRVDLGLNTRGATVSTGGRDILENETLRTQLIADIERSPLMTKLSVSRLNVTSSSNLVTLRKQGDEPMVVTIAPGKLPVGKGVISGTADLARLSKIAQPDADPSTQVRRGDAAFTLTFDTNAQKKEYEVRADATLSNLDIGDTLRSEQVKLVSRLFTPEDFSRVMAWADVFSQFGNLKLANADVRLADKDGKSMSPLMMLRSAEFSGNVQSLAKVHALVAGLSPARKGVEPLKVTGGSLTFGGKAGLDEKSGLLAIDFDIPAIEGVKVSRGSATFDAPKPMTLAMSIQVASDPLQGNVSKAIRELKVTRLQGDLFGEGRFKMLEPIVITDPAGNPTAAGKLEGTARLDFISDLIQTMTGGTPIGVLGNVSFQQTLQTDGSAIVLAGEASLTRLRPSQPGASPFPSDRIRIENGLRLDLVGDAAAISNFRIFTPGSDWLEIQATGSVKQLSTQRQLDNVALDISYDLKDLWPIFRPMIDPDGSTLGRRTVAEGKYKKRLTVTGSFPASRNGRQLAFHESVRSLSARGEITVDKFEAPDKGLWMQMANLPLELNGGILTLSGGGRDAQGNVTPIAFNKGQIDLGTIVVDFTKPSPTITMRRGTQLLKDVELNAQLASSYGKFASVLFKDTQQAFGKINLKVVEFNDVPTDIAAARGEQKGRMELSIDELFLDGLVPQLLGKALDTGEDGLRGYIRGSMLELSDGTSMSDLTVTLTRRETGRNQEGKRVEKIIELPLRFSGKIDLKTFRLVDTRLEFPTQLIKSRELQEFMGKTLVVPIRGSLDKPEFDIARAIQSNVQRGLIPGLLGGLERQQNRDRDR